MKQNRSQGRLFFFVIFGLLALAMLVLLQPFIGIIALSIVVVILLKPAFDWLMKRKWVGERRGLAATLTLLAFFLILVIPIIFLGSMLVNQAQDLVTSISTGELDSSMDSLLEQINSFFASTPPLNEIEISREDLAQIPFPRLLPCRWGKRAKPGLHSGVEVHHLPPQPEHLRYVRLCSGPDREIHLLPLTEKALVLKGTRAWHSRGTTLLAPHRRGLSIGDARSPRPGNGGRARPSLLRAMVGHTPSLRSVGNSGGIFDTVPGPGSHLSRVLWAGTPRLLVSIIAFDNVACIIP